MNVFTLTIFLGAFLLFQVQPLMAKFILPWFGGGPGVWTVCLLFFQVCLVGGYAYAHALSRTSSRRMQAGVHVALLLAALLFLPIVPSAHWKPDGNANPTCGILLLLAACLGLPYLMLAATGPLLQAWFSRVRPGVAPYRLYSVSNTGSLLALLSYPFVFEPLFTRRTQASLWSWTFSAFVALCGACAWQFYRARPRFSPDANGGQLSTHSEEFAPLLAAKAWWVALPACASVLLLATTNKLCLDVASVPFMWLLPLGLYLLSFVICFNRAAWYSRKVFTVVLVPLLAALCYTLSKNSRFSLWWQIAVFGGSLFAGCMVCHGEVCRLKPAPRWLTSFYLCLAAGGAVGGIFVGLAAPRVFRSYAELNWSFWLLAAYVGWLHFRERTQLRIGEQSWTAWPLLASGVMALGLSLVLISRRGVDETIFMSRNFYGVLRVIEGAVNTPCHGYKLNNGCINHGLQFADPRHCGLATTYYHAGSGVGVALDTFPRQINRRVGVVGLGVGTLATYGHSGDTFRFYEIDPEVERLAKTGFSFLKNSTATIELVTGDARLSLERESSQQFDMLVLDAFSSDAVPVHLLTLEAFDTYFRHLKADGVIAVHASNCHLDFLPVLVGVAKHFRVAIICLDWDDPHRPWWFSSSRWVLLSRNQPFIYSQPLIALSTRIPEGYAQNPTLWTDDYASLFNIVKPWKAGL